MDNSEIQELVLAFPGLQQVKEAGIHYFLLPNLHLPEGCNPNVVDALLCPVQRDGYNSRLFFSSRIATPVQRNWNGNARILDRTWHAISWRVPTPLRLMQMILTHLDALKR